MKTIGFSDKDPGDIPLKYMKTWLDIDSVQHAQQESVTNNYLLNTISEDIDVGDDFEF